MREKRFNSLDKVKRQIDNILSYELDECRFIIYPHYNAGNDCSLFSYRIKDRNLYLYINIQTVMSFVERNNWDTTVSLYLCAWYVAGYIKSLTEGEQQKEFNTYCDGVINSERLYSCFSNKKIKVFVPIICEKLGRHAKRMRVMDVLCEVNVLFRVKALFDRELQQDDQVEIEKILDELMLYLKSPEVIYTGTKTPGLSIKEFIKNIRAIDKKSPGTNVISLPQKDDKSIVNNLINAYKIKKDMFWLELLAHMTVCSPNSIKSVNDDMVAGKIYEYIEQYENRLIEDMGLYGAANNKLLIDNLAVMLKYNERGKKLLLKVGFVKSNKRTIHINF